MRVAKYWRKQKLRYRLIRRAQSVTAGESASRLAQRNEPADRPFHKITPAEYAT